MRVYRFGWVQASFFIAVLLPLFAAAISEWIASPIPILVCLLMFAFVSLPWSDKFLRMGLVLSTGYLVYAFSGYGRFRHWDGPDWLWMLLILSFITATGMMLFQKRRNRRLAFRYSVPEGARLSEQLEAFQRALRENQERMERMAPLSREVVAEIGPDRCYTYISPACREVFGYEPDEMLHRSIFEFIHEEDRELVKQLPDATEPKEVSYRLIRKDGTVIWLETRWMRTPSKSGRDVVIAVSRDVSDRVSSDHRLKQMGDLFEMILNYTTEGVILIETGGRVVHVNPAFVRLTGYSPKDQHELASLVPEIYRDQISAWQAAVNTGVVIHGQELAMMHKDGAMLDVNVTILPIKDHRGDVVMAACIIRDHTVLKKTEELLQTTEKLSIAGQLAAGIAHEIRNPLTSLKGFLQLMESGNTPKHEYFKIMSSELNRIEGIVSELLLLTKPKEHDYRQKDVRAIIHDVIMLLESQANMNGVKIITRFDSDRTIIYCDENQIKQVIINFVKNGIEAMQNGGEMVIQVNRVGEEVVIKFSDQGCGIPEDKLAMLGQPFYTTKPKGTGLGLMISYGIIEHHKGTVSVMSKVGVGTTFVVKLPVLQHERPHVSRSRPRGNEENAI